MQQAQLGLLWALIANPGDGRMALVVELVSYDSLESCAVALSMVCGSGMLATP